MIGGRYWKQWDGGATYLGHPMVGSRVLGSQELGHVEFLDGRWRWAVRPIPGPIGAFVDGFLGSEAEARREVEARWTDVPLQTY